MFIKYLFYNKGISINEYYRTKTNDINIVLSLDEAFQQKKIQQAEINKMLAQAQGLLR